MGVSLSLSTRRFCPFPPRVAFPFCRPRGFLPNSQPAGSRQITKTPQGSQAITREAATLFRFGCFFTTESIHTYIQADLFIYLQAPVNRMGIRTTPHTPFTTSAYSCPHSITSNQSKRSLIEPLIPLQEVHHNRSSSMASMSLRRW